MRYRVTAGQSCLRTFRYRALADQYAKDVVAQSDPNIGPVVLEREEPETGDWESVADYGAPQPSHLLQTRLPSIGEFYDRFRLIPTSTNADVALIRSHIAYWTGFTEALSVDVKPSRGHSYRVSGSRFYVDDRIVRITDHYDHREGVVGWN